MNKLREIPKLQALVPEKDKEPEMNKLKEIWMLQT